MKRLTGVWLRDGKGGKKFMVGRQARQELIKTLQEMDSKEVSLFVFKNNRKETDKHPDYNIAVAPATPRKAPKETKKEEKEEVTDEVPF